ncbi:alpha/beta fold hydrolase [Cupriavidus sp. 2TAF22]|uniref:alpha/beta fold hydrolase n=1 Tax=unclassified Cupriavidus TaxID=2640874 RepID=UPI003F8DA792
MDPTAMTHPEATQAGAGKGLLVFVHGYLDGPETWQPLLAALHLPGWRHLVVRLAASGDASASSQALLAAYAAQVAAGVAASGHHAGQPVVVIGHSMGGQVAELAAAGVAGGVSGLVLITPAPLRGYPLPPAVLEKFQSRAGLTDLAQIRDGKRALTINPDDAALDVLAATTARTSRAFALEQLRAWSGGHPAGADASAVGSPVLTITTDDKFFTAALLEDGAKRFASATIDHVADAGHWPQVEQPARLARFIERFIERIIERRIARIGPQ